MFNSPVAWFSRTQKCVTLSTTVGVVCDNVGWGQKNALCMECSNSLIEPNEELSVIKILEDNKEAIALLGKNAASSSNSKHVRHHS